MTTVVETHPCVGCGAEVERELPPEGAFGRDVLLTVLRCDHCAGELEDREAEAEREHALEQERQRLRRRVKASGLPSRLLGLPWPDETGPAINAARSWAGDGGGLVLTGPVGVGKTYLAATACGELLRGRACSWLSAPLLFARLGSGLGSQQRDEALEVLTGTGALVLDDLDKVRPTDYGAEHVFLAVDTRITSGAPLLVTTNLSLGELAVRFPEPYGEAIASRLVGYCKVVGMSGPDRRTA